MPGKSIDENPLLKEEFKVVKEAEKIIDNHKLNNDFLYDEYNKLLKNYKKLLNQLNYILKISDKFQLELISGTQKLKKVVENKSNTEEKLLNKIEELKETKSELKKTNKKLAKLSSRDQLTGLFNRRTFEEKIEKEWKNAIRELEPIAIIMLDIDNFKDFNDNYGHLAGDNCLQKISRKLEQTLKRPRDFVARYGGEEFIAVLPETDTEGAKKVAERIRSNIESLKIPHNYSPVADHVTLSLGVAVTDEADLFVFEELMDKADQALYEAKDKGKNTFVYHKLN